MASTFRPAPDWRPAAPSIPRAPAADVRSLSLTAAVRTRSNDHERLRKPPPPLAHRAARGGGRGGAPRPYCSGMPALDALRERLAELADLASLQRLTGWDQRTMMPPAGAPARAQQSATLERLVHDRATADDIGAWLEEIDGGGDGLGEVDADLVRLARRDWERRAPDPARARLRPRAGVGRGPDRVAVGAGARTTSPPSRPPCGATSTWPAPTRRASTTSSIPTTRCSPTTTSASRRRACARSSTRSPRR